MNAYEKLLKEKKEYKHKKPSDKSYDLKKAKVQRMQKIKKNAQFGMF